MISPNQDVPTQPGPGIQDGVSSNAANTASRQSQDDDSARAQYVPETKESELSERSSKEPIDTNKSGDDVRISDGGSKTKAEVLSSIEALEQDLERVKFGFPLEKKLNEIENRWDESIEQEGSDMEGRRWRFVKEERSQHLLQEATAFAFGKEWLHDSQKSFVQKMIAREEFEKKLNLRRLQWEAKRGIAPSPADVSIRSASEWPNYGRHLTMSAQMYDGISFESLFNDTMEAKGYDAQERQLRGQIHEVIRQKYECLRDWVDRFQRHEPAEDARRVFYHDVQPRSTIIRAKWEHFKSCSPKKTYLSENRKTLYAVDVLEGEPEVNLMKRHWPSPRAHSSEIPFDFPEAEQMVVPERIRLNCPESIYTSIGLARGASWRLGVQTILLQPYRVLIYNERKIRGRQETLKKKLDEFTKQDDPPHVSVQAHEDTDQASDGKQSTPLDPIDTIMLSQAKTETAVNYISCVIKFLDIFVVPRRDYVQGTHCRQVYFRDLWYLFSPGDEVIRLDRKQVYKVIGVGNPRHKGSLKNAFFDFNDNGSSMNFEVTCVYVDFDGKRLGPVLITFAVKPFAGERPVDSLEVYPLRLHICAVDGRTNLPVPPDTTALRQRLIQRGKRFFEAACMRLDNAFYNGPTAEGDEVESQVVVDFETALASGTNFEKGLVPNLESLLSNTDNPTEPIPADDVRCLGPCCEGEYVFNDDFVDTIRREDFVNSFIPKAHGKLPSVAVYPRALEDTIGENALTDEEFLIMTYRVFAFVLRTRKWAELDLTYMEDETRGDVQSKDKSTNRVEEPAFEQLVLPDGHKNIVMSLISQYYRNRYYGRRGIDQSDIVKGKGKGLILLLHGAPGVGKTSTAEGIAEKFKKPLFTITCGDLGSTAREVEQALDLNFSLANRWGCILLLDEADVFLSSRTDDNFERNGLVAVFLRVLEYYAGILFLTTNRVGVIDEAFRSRVHISLYYPPLGYQETRAVFKLNLKLIEDRFNIDKRNIDIERDEIIDFALDYFRIHEKARWNGRQIRNACQTALALAEFKAQGEDHERWDPNADVRLSVENFKTVSKAYLEFTKYLDHLYGMNNEWRAKERGLREPHADFMRSAASTGTFEPYGNAQSYNIAPSIPAQAVHSQAYQPAPVTRTAHLSPTVGFQQPDQQVPYQSMPVQDAPRGNIMDHRSLGQFPAPVQPKQAPQPGQTFSGMQFQHAQSHANRQSGPWLGQVGPEGMTPLQQQQFQTFMQQQLRDPPPPWVSNSQEAPQVQSPNLGVQGNVMQSSRVPNPSGPSPPQPRKVDDGGFEYSME
ncbi:hypothetical protein KVR01_000305 [Diaporthe batatas]|uniref:uncharacterized protein n=1 Tax=Diaporthe batatas TaxID=748121 RepID=UPI001D03A416|nr:uncharacterized protein KVR01_000305 [Diaporthe batatas]KAG8169560.1 hypothetical protein KVR01_000305 [Diaporthe batatas]